MDVAIPIFDGITALDAIGPYEVLSRLPDTRVHFVAAEPGDKRTENGMLALRADATLSSLAHPDVVVVPGGFGTRALMKDEAVLDWVRTAHESSQWTTSVCTGALVLGAAGILNGLPATNRFLVVHGIFYCEVRRNRLLRVRGFFDVYDAATQLGVLPAHGTMGEKALLVLRGFGLRAGRSS